MWAFSDDKCWINCWKHFTSIRLWNLKYWHGKCWLRVLQAFDLAARLNKLFYDIKMCFLEQSLFTVESRFLVDRWPNLIFTQPTSKATVLAIIEKAREVCVPIQTAKKTKPGKASKSTAVAEPAAKDVKKFSEEPKKSSEEPKKSKAVDKKPASKKVSCWKK